MGTTAKPGRRRRTRSKAREHSVITTLIAALGAVAAAGLGSFIVVRCQASPPNAVPAAFQGTWVGQTDEHDGTSPYRTTITVGSGTSHQDIGDSSYAVDGGCHGLLTLSTATPTTLTMVERIDSGPCVPTGSVTLTLKTRDEVAYTYTGDKRSGTRQTADGTLRKIG
ncbi:hypothetical protein ACFWJ4_15310 [Kitasatospora sp. NPDC127067]|uniref:hypothetical protein n=1 Tax=Kitasatospora sp. NPDC127067 TaxID=3347126 RepID=UPI00365E789D